MKHTPVWYCVYDVNTLEYIILDKAEVGGPKINDGTSEKELATNLEKVVNQSRDAFIAELQEIGVNFEPSNVKV